MGLLYFFFLLKFHTHITLSEKEGKSLYYLFIASKQVTSI
nr:MAG TPA: hypothetical protein [Caudoviricetes sp.]